MTWRRHLVPPARPTRFDLAALRCSGTLGDVKYIVVPEPITIRLTNGKPVQKPKDDAPDELVDWVMTFAEFIYGRLNDQTFAKGMAEVLQAAKIQRCVDEMKDGVLVLEDADYEQLKKATATPTGGYDPRFAISFVPFLEAICAHVKSVPPTVAAVDEEKSESGE
jgi:hypothetical protein